MKNNMTRGHMAAFITILIWGTTFISTKVLLTQFTPIEILFIRFLIGYITLWCVYPHKIKCKNKKEELYFILAGLCGVTLYYLFENIALTYTLASNVGVIISIAPFFTMIFAVVLHERHLDMRFILGFMIAMIGITMISYQSSALQLNPLGDILAVIAAVIWAVYSTLTKKISTFGYSTIQSTRHIFFYGLVCMLPVLGFMGFDVQLEQFTNFKMLGNLLFLGFGASALCFVTWNHAVKVLGSVKTSVYIYMVPVITAVTSAFILHEVMTFYTLCGIVFTLAGLLLSQKMKEEKEHGYEKREVRYDFER